MKGIIGFIMVIAAMYPPCAYARGIHVISPVYVTAPATAASSANPEKEAAKAAKKAKKEAEKKARKNKKKKKNAIPDGAIASASALTDTLAKYSPFSAEIVYDVALPMASDEITYTLKIGSSATQNDNLSPADYLIDWTLSHNDTDSNGFLAYFNGNHYRYRDHRLQEYHYAENSEPFTSARGGVQNNGQFVDMIPQMVAQQLLALEEDPDYTITFNPDTISDGINCVVLTATQSVNGEVGRSYRIIADRFTGRPLLISNLYNPGKVSEQTVTAKFRYNPGEQFAAAKSEEQLESLYPDIFTKYRDRGNRIEHMRGLPLPSFSLPAIDGSRFTHEKGESLGRPTVIAIIDPESEQAAETVALLRKAIGEAERSAALILAFTESNLDLASELAPGTKADETVVVSAHSLAQECGTAVFPTILVADPAGKVSNVLLGFNNNLVQDVIQSLALVN